MAAVVICDKCGMSCRDLSMFMHIRSYRLTSPNEFENTTRKHMDVCKECYKKIFNEEDHK